MNGSHWNHGYSFCGGAIAGLALSYQPWLIFAAGIIVGVTLTMLFKLGRSLGAKLTARLGTGRPAARPVPIYNESRGATHRSTGRRKVV